MTPQEFKQIRKDLGETQKELAKNLGLSKDGDVTIRRIESGRGNSSKILQTCLKYYQILKKHNMI